AESSHSGVVESLEKIVVLLVDDQAIVGHAVKQMLAPEEDIELHFCQEPTQAIARANELRPSVILQDLVMPDIDGLTLLKFFRANPSTKETPMIVLSSKEEPTTKAHAFALGASDYLVKLPDRIELIARIRHHSRGYIAQLQRNEAYRKLAESERKLAQEVAQAEAYVRSLLPKPLTDGPVRIDWRFVPSTQLAGDAFGYRWLDEKQLAIYLLDVSGHGVGSALLAVSVLNVLTHSSLPDTDFQDPAAVMRGLNAIFQMDRHGDKYFTIWYGVYGVEERKLTFSGGGHPPPYLMQTSAESGVLVSELRTDGPPIGITDALPFENQSTSVSPGAQLLIYSDGAVEIDLPDSTVTTQGDFNELINALGPCEGLMDQIVLRGRELRQKDTLNDDCSLMVIDF
ncbi:MAG TPA: SpoIIE family protein phosphatase, partial [Tepidisphaeraceae bacterium]|nr:SpoIIE family protein phosphatase [Tepidisphaeraceae bacterium]